MKYLKKDIERYYQLAGSPKVAGFWVVFFACFNPRLLPVVLLRASSFFYKHRLGLIAKVLSFMNLVLFGIETSPRVKVGAGLFLPHTVGTILGAESIGTNAIIMHGVTLGARQFDFHFSSNSRPIVGNNVFIGAGAIIVGPITIGDYAKIGANAVVLNDVPSHSLVVGVPARVVNESKG